MTRAKGRRMGREARAALRAEDPLAAGMTEAQLQAAAEGLLRYYGWRYLHVPDNKPRQTKGGRVVRARITPGFPDVIATRRLPGYGPELLVAEFKTEAGRFGPGQEEWLADFTALMVSVQASGKIAAREVEIVELPAIGVYVWRPTDLRDGTIEEVLAGPAGAGVVVDNTVH